MFGKPKQEYKYELNDGGASLLRYQGKEENVVLPDSFDGRPLTALADNAFYDCKKLVSVTIPESVASVGSGCFKNCVSLKSVRLPEKLASLGDYAFALCKELEGVSLPETLTTIGVAGLRNCNKITTIAIPASVTSIGEDAFENVPLNTVYFDGSKAQWDAITGDGKPTNVTVIYGAFTVTFLDGQGKTLKTETVKKGEDATAPSAPTRDGYTFNGWDKEFSNVTQDLTVTAQWKKSPEPKPTPAKVSGTPIAKTTASGKNSLTIEWNKVNDAAGYDIFFSQCNNNGKKASCKNVKNIKGNNTFKWTKSGLKKGTAYKAYVKAYVMQDGKKKYVKASPIMHAYTGNGTKKFTNAKSVSVNKAKVTLKKGKSFKIKAKVKKVKKNKKLMPKSHAPKLRYLTSNSKVATVSKSGKITAKGKGTCEVYAYAHNGVYKKIKVTVK